MKLKTHLKSRLCETWNGYSIVFSNGVRNSVTRYKAAHRGERHRLELCLWIYIIMFKWRETYKNEWAALNSLWTGSFKAYYCRETTDRNVASKIGASAHWVVVEQEETLCRHREHFWDLTFIVLIISVFFLVCDSVKTWLVVMAAVFLLIEQHEHRCSIRSIKGEVLISIRNNLLTKGNNTQ